ncbi:PAS domain S-box protein [Geobacter sp. DSM 9736]|uniref:PAS domain S-box protein n=1 Tax=Geobacter sp. DSM 9736 TaxID=1277350 RepID=UPI000B604056|nr:PAS domain S-box protein [Geobacter sp. DSM 9736]SNB44752.1 PAS domain S-box-containing protein [Geobacter sp. DSM 9736]
MDLDEYEELKTRKRYGDALNDINALIHSTTDIDTIMERVVVEVARAVGAESAVIYVPNDDVWNTRYVYGLPMEMAGRDLTAEEIRYSVIAAVEGKTLVIDDPLHDDRVDPAIIERYGITAILDIPLTAAGELIGDFSLHYHTAGRTFGEAEVDFAVKAASSIILALENAILFNERREAAKALGETGEKLEFALEAAGIGAWEVDLRTGKGWCSSQHHRIFGYPEPPQEWTSERFLRHVLPEDRERVESNIRSIVRTGADLKDVCRIRRADGEVRLIEAKIIALHDGSGNVSGLRGVVQDVTALKQTEERVIESLDRIMILLSVSSSVLNETTIEGILDRAVHGALLLTGAEMAASGHGFDEGRITVGARSDDADLPPCPESPFIIDRGGVYLDLIEGSPKIRLTQEELTRHPAWWGLPEGHPPLRGLLGARLAGFDGKPNGMILVSHKRQGDFTDEDEALLSQLGLLTSLGIRHIEARAAAEARANELEAVKKRLEIILQNTPAFVYLMDEENRFLHVNRRYEEAVGFSSDELRGRSIFDFFPNEYAATLAANNRQILETCAAAEFEEAIPHDDGIHLYSSVKSPLFDNTGRCHAVIGISTDITSRKRAEAALRESEELFRDVFAHAPVGMAICDPGGRFLYVNGAYCGIVGYDREEILGGGLGFQQLTHPEDVGTNVELFQRLVAGELPYFFLEKRNIRKDGSSVWVRISVTVRRDAEERPFQAIALVEDIHDRKMAEHELNRTLEELARSNRELEQFAYVASHDLQEPLRMISGYLVLLERKYRGRLDEKADSYIHFAVDGAQRMQKLIEALLSWSRITTRGAELEPVNMGGALADAVANLAAVIGETGAEMKADPLPTVTGDATLLIQLFQNLIGNALKYTKPGVPPRVHVSAHRDGNEWVFFVRDNGIGIQHQHFDRIFQIFQRLHTREEYPGTGIGLAACKKIVERHHGRIWVESTPGDGSTFFFTLPAA